MPNDQVTVGRELLPCPFCGEPASAPKSRRESTDPRDGYVAFMACFCGGYSATAHRMGRGGTEQESVQDVINLWNTRTILAQPAPSDGVEVVAYLLQHESGARLVDLNSQSIQVAQQEHGGIVHKLVMLEAHNAEVARLREDRDSHQLECIKALAGYDSLRGDAAALVKKCLDEERECWTGDSRQAVHLALDDAYARVLIALSQQSTP